MPVSSSPFRALTFECFTSGMGWVRNRLDWIGSGWFGLRWIRVGGKDCYGRGAGGGAKRNTKYKDALRASGRYKINKKGWLVLKWSARVI